MILLPTPYHQQTSDTRNETNALPAESLNASSTPTKLRRINIFALNSSPSPKKFPHSTTDYIHSTTDIIRNCMTHTDMSVINPLRFTKINSTCSPICQQRYTFQGLPLYHFTIYV